MPFLEPIWSQLLSLSDSYIQEYVVEGHDTQGEYDSEGDVVGFETMLYSMLEYVSIATRKKGLRSLMTQGQGNAGEFLNLLASVLIKYMQITVEMVRFFCGLFKKKENTWSTDVNQFIQDDEDEALNFNVRIAVEELLQVSFESVSRAYRHLSIFIPQKRRKPFVMPVRHIFNNQLLL